MAIGFEGVSCGYSLAEDPSKNVKTSLLTITSSDYLGCGEKQNDDLLHHNYSVAKATIDCNFELDKLVNLLIFIYKLY